MGEAFDASSWLTEPLSSLAAARSGDGGSSSSAASLLLPPKTLAFARRNQLFNLGQIMLLSRQQIQEMLKIPIYEVDTWRRDVIEMAYKQQTARMRAQQSGASSSSAGPKSLLAHKRRREAQDTATAAKGKGRAYDDEDQWVTMGDALLDQAVGGKGLRKGMLTDIVGESASGKSQLVMQMAVYAALGLKTKSSDDGDQFAGFDRSKARSVALLMSEGDIQSLNFSHRMDQMARATLTKRWMAARQGIDDKPVKIEADGSLAAYLDEASALLLQNLHIAKVVDMDAIEHAVMYTLPGLADRLSRQPTPPSASATAGPSSATSVPAPHHHPPPLGLVIVDNIASIYHPVEAGTSFNALVERSRHNAMVANELRRIAIRGENGAACAVVIVNQVQDCFEREVDAARAIFRQQSKRPRSQQGHAGSSNGAATQPPSSSSSAHATASSSRSASSRSRSAGNAAAVPPPLAPLAYAVQSPFFTGQLATMVSAPVSADAQSTRLLPSHRAKQAALSNTWNNCINARVVLGRSHVALDDDDEGGGGGQTGVRTGTRSRPIGICLPGDGENAVIKQEGRGGSSASPLVALRTLDLVFAPWAAPSRSQFVVTSAGCEGWQGGPTRGDERARGSGWTFMPLEREATDDHDGYRHDAAEEEEALYADGGKRSRDDFERALAGLDEEQLGSQMR